MEVQILLILLPLVVTGLGFLSYKHPVFARRLTVLLILLVLTANMIVQTVFRIKRNSRDEVNTFLTQPIFRDKTINEIAKIPFDTLKIFDPILNGTDSSRFNVSEELRQIDKTLKAFTYGFGATKIQLSTLQYLIKKDNEEYYMQRTVETILMWCTGGLVVFLFLSYAFYYLRNPPSKKNNNSTDNSTY